MLVKLWIKLYSLLSGPIKYRIAILGSMRIEGNVLPVLHGVHMTNMKVKMPTEQQCTYSSQNTKQIIEQ